jgi:hypothetical protein
MNDSEQIPHTVRLPNDSEMVKHAPEGAAAFAYGVSRLVSFLALVLSISWPLSMLLNLLAAESLAHLLSSTLPFVMVIVALVLQRIAPTSVRDGALGVCLVYFGVAMAFWPPAFLTKGWVAFSVVVALLAGMALCVDWLGHVLAK